MAEPTADRPYIPDYGIPTDTKGMLPYSYAAEGPRRPVARSG
ncbi:MAG: hypothetical protein ABR529_04920 [Actinomycetota bacterium]